MRFVAIISVTFGCLLLASCDYEANEAVRSPDTQQPDTRQNAFGKTLDTTALSKDQTVNQKLEYAFNDYANLPTNLFKPVVDAPDYYIAYMKDIDRAYFDLKAGSFSKAADGFSAIGKESLFEMPNDATWSGHAESLCRMGDKNLGKQKLKNAQCSLELLSNTRTCTDLDRQKSDVDFPSDCYREYCEAEILRSDYDDPNAAPIAKEFQDKLIDYGQNLASIKAICQ